MLNQQIQNYKIISLLGEGGMAYVYLAEHVKLNKKVAVKVLKDNFIRNGNIRNRFIAEAKSLAEINHPNVIKVFDFIEEDRLIAFVMEYISGSTLGKLIEEKGKFKDVEINEIFTQMLQSINFIHKKGFIHRDIKPSNFMVKPDGTLILLDFGIAKHLEQVNGEYTETGEFHIMGTPIYMSLEQFGSTKNVTQSSDIYCLGLVLWLMITGKQPFIINEKIDIIELLKRKEKKLPLTKTKWDAIIQPMTQPNVSNRIKTCYEINKLLENQKPTTKNSLFISILIKIIFQFKEKVSKVDEKMINVLGVKIHFLIKLVIFVIVVIAMNQFFSTYFTENK